MGRFLIKLVKFNECKNRWNRHIFRHYEILLMLQSWQSMEL